MGGSSLQTIGATTKKSRLPKLRLVLGSCCEIDDLNSLGIFQRSRRLAKFCDCCVDKARHVRVECLNLIRQVTGSQSSW